MPRHIAIIMDGNGRWAEQRGLPRTEGHRQGVEALRRTVAAAIELGIPIMTVFSFSSENWSRPRSEIIDLMGLIKRFIRRDLAELHKAQVRIRVIGERAGLDPEIVAMIGEAEALTRGNDGLQLVVAFNYGGRDEIVRATRAVAEEVAAGRLRPDAITQETLESHLDTAGLPHPDLLVRTSGEIRLSNFLLWQLAYAEFVFLDAYWPEFNKEMLAAAIAEYQGRSRRFGGLSARSMA